MSNPHTAHILDVAKGALRSFFGGGGGSSDTAEHTPTAEQHDQQPPPPQQQQQEEEEQQQQQQQHDSAPYSDAPRVVQSLYGTGYKRTDDGQPRSEAAAAVDEVAEDVRRRAEGAGRVVGSTTREAGEAVGEVAEDVRRRAEGAGRVVGGTAREAGEAVERTAERTAEAAGEAGQTVREAAGGWVCLRLPGRMHKAMANQCHAFAILRQRISFL